MAQWKAVMSVQSVPAGRINAISLDGTKVILLKVDGAIVAYEDQCPHEEYPLSLGELDDCILTCSKHLWEFDVTTGRNLCGGAGANRNLRRYEVRVVDGVVEVNIGDLLAAEGANE